MKWGVNMVKKRIIITIAYGVAGVLLATAYSWHCSSDEYIFSHIEELRNVKFEFKNHEWMMIEIIDAGSSFPWHYPGAVYLVDSNGRRRKISGGYVKPAHFTMMAITNALKACSSADEAWTNCVWTYTFPWATKAKK